MPEEQQRHIIRCEDDLRRRIHLDGLTPRQAFEAVREDYDDFGVNQSVLEALDIAYQGLEARIRRIDRLSIINSARFAPDPWYGGAMDADPSWSAYKAHLISKGWADNVESIHQSSDEIVSLLHRPGLSSFKGRGLVIGYVQSGKTANMTAVIAKASDAGYRLIIVLTGMIEKLRQQTQVRLEEDLLYQPNSGNWHRWTTLEADFIQPTNPGFQFNVADRNIFVMKKNAAILRRFLGKLENTTGAELQKCSVLIIDDECDQASVNAPGYDGDWKAINRLIREVLDKFSRSSYVGYTATPFANVLIDPDIDPDRPEDLYPRDYIYSLPRPDGYFGAERLFGRDVLDAETDPGFDEELDMIRTVPDDEIPLLRPSGRQNRAEPEATPSLLEAINYYLIASATRDLRGHRNKHSSMLIHTSQLVNDQTQMYENIRSSIDLIKAKIERDNPDYRSNIELLWDRENTAVPPELFGNKSFSFDQIWNQMKSVVTDVELVVENSRTPTHRIDYEGAPPDEGRRYICIGGNVLARGLTLEGLVSSFFVRTSNQYDTLMQMGRWFGYRAGYEDLQRVWMTSDMQDNFFSLATVEADIRQQILNTYREGDNTPLDLAVRIRQIPGLAITAANKMLAAERCNFSFAGKHIQTTRFFHRSSEILTANYSAGERLVSSAVRYSEVENRDQGLLIRNVRRSLVETFLNEFQIHGSQLDLVSEDGGRNHLLNYIGRCKELDPENLRSWNVGIVQARTGQARADNLNLGPLTNLRSTNRSMFRLTSSGDANIKALMSRSDIRIDLESSTVVEDDWDSIKAERLRNEGSSCPLLLLYIVDKDSEPRNVARSPSGIARGNVRQALGATDHVLGFGIVFPSAEGDGVATFEVQVRLPQAVDAEELTLEEVEELM